MILNLWTQPQSKPLVKTCFCNVRSNQPTLTYSTCRLCLMQGLKLDLRSCPSLSFPIFFGFFTLYFVTPFFSHRDRDGIPLRALSGNLLKPHQSDAIHQFPFLRHQIQTLFSINSKPVITLWAQRRRQRTSISLLLLIIIFNRFFFELDTPLAGSPLQVKKVSTVHYPRR